ncbi:MAG: phosphotransferase [Desulfobacteraceae bacterium]|nr:phosphotransferase [Desulfobacteraceae bacterium]
MRTPSSPETLQESRDQELVLALLRREGLASGTVGLVPLGGDGSDRRFFRVTRDHGPGLVAVLPSPTLPRARAEARSAFLIGRHLHARGVPVPAILGYSEDEGLILFEDLGTVLLHEVIKRLAGRPGEILGWYRKAVDALIRLQLDGGHGFDPDFCWDGGRYDVPLMLERESGYFLHAFCRDLLGLGEGPPGLAAEFQAIAARAAAEPANTLLHRDFQCRNLMVRGGEVVIIDFQGARLGPLGYDLASLLLDPYAGLFPELQEEILRYYIEALGRRLPIDGSRFREGYFFLRLQRNLQIIGAYAFLSGQKGKPFFRQFLLPALATLDSHLRQPAGAAFPCLRALAADCLARLTQQETP